MSERTRLRVVVNGQDVTKGLRPFLVDAKISKSRDPNSDTADITLDDTYERARLPPKRSLLEIYVGRGPGPLQRRFRGRTDEPRSSGGRAGRVLTIHAKATPMDGKLVERQAKDWDDKDLETILREAGELAGISDVLVDEELAKITRAYEAMDAESFLAFGTRIASEVGGLFKVEDDVAILGRRNRDRTPGGSALPTYVVRAGENLYDWDIIPTLDRWPFAKHETAWFDRDAAEWKRETADAKGDQADEAGQATRKTTPARADGAQAKDEADASSTDAESKAGEGTLSCEGDARLVPEGSIILLRARAGCNGRYTIANVDDTIDRSGAWVASLTLERPGGGAGRDER